MDAAIFGLIVADLLASPMDIRHPPPAGGLQFVDRIELATGGNVPNTGVAMARLGMNVAAAGLVGQDTLGAHCSNDSTRPASIPPASSPTIAPKPARSIVAVEPGGERCFFHVPGTTKLLDADAFRRCFPVFAQCDSCKSAISVCSPRSRPICPWCSANSKPPRRESKIALDTVNPPGPKSELQPILPLLDIFCPSRTEAGALTGETDAKKMVAAFRRHMKQGLVGIKLDAEGCYLDDATTSVFAPAYKVNVIDTTGAGDTWFGALLVALRKNMPLQQAAHFANRTAADCCTALGHLGRGQVV